MQITTPSQIAKYTPIIPILMFLLFVGCGENPFASPPRPKATAELSDWNRLRVGMSPSKVRSILGPPTKTTARDSVRGPRTDWSYDFSDKVEPWPGYEDNRIERVGSVTFKQSCFSETLVSWTPPPEKK